MRPKFSLELVGDGVMLRLLPAQRNALRAAATVARDLHISDIEFCVLFAGQRDAVARILERIAESDRFLMTLEDLRLVYNLFRSLPDCFSSEEDFYLRTGYFERTTAISRAGSSGLWRTRSGQTHRTPAKPTDIHPQLRGMYPDGIRPQFANSNVAALVEFAWRWDRLVGVLSRMVREAAMEAYRMRMEGHGEAAIGPDSPSALLLAQYEILLASLGRIDPRAVADDAFWRRVVMDY